MSRRQRAQQLRKAKDRRMKMVALGGVVLLAVVLAFEVPKMMKNGSSSSAPPAATTTTGTATTPAATTTPAGTAAAAVLPTAASTKLPNSDAAPRSAKSQLYSFTHFSGKDPFVQQVSDQQPTTAGSGGTSGQTKPTSGQTAAKVTHNQSSRLLATTGAVSLSVNGHVQVVKVGASFPSANPLFRLVGISHGVARIGIANGSYSSGAHTVTLAAGRTLTLVDTADGVRYHIRLLAAA